MTDHVSCDFYQMDELIRGNHIKRKEDFSLLEQLAQRGYMEESGYSRASPRAAELDEMMPKGERWLK